MQFVVGNIVQLKLDLETVNKLNDFMKRVKDADFEAKAIDENNLHITLWKPTRDDRIVLQKANKHTPTNLLEISFKNDKLCVVSRPGVEIQGKKISHKRSWLVVVDQQEALRNIVDEFARAHGLYVSDYELRRPFHVSIANLTGSPFDSVGDVEWDDVKNGAI